VEDVTPCTLNPVESVPAELGEPLVVDSEVMAELMEDGPANLVTQLGFGKPHVQVRATEDDDPVGESAPVVAGTFLETHPFIYPESVAKRRGGILFHENVEVVDLGYDPVGQVLKDLVDCTLEFGTIHQR
jgi:hypothetical protein